MSVYHKLLIIWLPDGVWIAENRKRLRFYSILMILLSVPDAAAMNRKLGIGFRGPLTPMPA
jgi:hypothetical protein